MGPSQGYPSKWANWWTIKDIASRLGILSEVDWPTLFSSFFANVRIKIKCKDPVKVPRERVYELGGSCYLITFLIEGVEQIADPAGKDHGKGDYDHDPEDPDPEEDLEEEDLLDDVSKDSEKTREKEN